MTDSSTASPQGTTRLALRPQTGALPEREEILDGIWRLPLPLADSPLGHVNAYLVRSRGGCLLIDCGWDTADSLRALEGHLHALGLRFADIHGLVVTHVHPDHYGLAGRLREITNAALRFHRLEQMAVESRYANADELLGEMREWLHLNGVPAADLNALCRASTGMLDRVVLAYPDEVLEGGEELQCGDFTLRVLWTPGHSAGHICLYEPVRKVLFSGDHVLGRISPAVGLHARAQGNPLADYLDALQQVRCLDAQVVLPGHGDPFTGLAGRVEELLAHHARRFMEIQILLEPEAHTAYEVARQMSWGRGRAWADLSAYQQRLALTETLAHLEVLHAQHRAIKQFVGGVVRYVAVPDSPGSAPVSRPLVGSRQARSARHQVRR